MQIPKLIGGEREQAPYLDVVNGSHVCTYVRTYVCGYMSNDYAYVTEFTHTSFVCMHMRTR